MKFNWIIEKALVWALSAGFLQIDHSFRWRERISFHGATLQRCRSQVKFKFKFQIEMYFKSQFKKGFTLIACSIRWRDIVEPVQQDPLSMVIHSNS